MVWESSQFHTISHPFIHFYTHFTQFESHQKMLSAVHSKLDSIAEEMKPVLTPKLEEAISACQSEILDKLEAAVHAKFGGREEEEEEEEEVVGERGILSDMKEKVEAGVKHGVEKVSETMQHGVSGILDKSLPLVRNLLEGAMTKHNNGLSEKV